MQNDISFFRIHFDLDWPHDAAAGIGPVTGVDIHMQGTQAPWTMIAGTVAERLYFESAIFADKGIIIFLESFLLHRMPPTEYGPRHGDGLGDFRVRTAFDEGPRPPCLYRIYPIFLLL